MTPPVLIESAIVTATTTFPVVDIRNAEKITLMFTRTNHSAGSSTYTIEGSLDGTTFVALNTLIDNVTNSNSQHLTRVASCALSSNTSKIYSLDLENFNYKQIRVIVTEVTDGSHNYKMLMEF
jgi:hypothetical protein